MPVKLARSLNAVGPDGRKYDNAGGRARDIFPRPAAAVAVAVVAIEAVRPGVTGSRSRISLRERLLPSDRAYITRARVFPATSSILLGSRAATSARANTKTSRATNKRFRLLILEPPSG